MHGWPEMPEGRDLGAVSGVGIDPHGNVFVFHRNDRDWPSSDELSLEPIADPTITVFDADTGKVLNEWGENTFAMAQDGAVYVGDITGGRIQKFVDDN